MLKRQWKKTFLYLFILTVIIVVSIAFAYYNTEDQFVNRFVSSTYHVNIEEEFYDTWGDKKVYFKNTEETNVDIVVRMSYNEYWKDSNNNYLNNIVNGVNIVTKTWTNTFLDDFVDGGDGWYYYSKVLSAEEQIQVLNSIELNKTTLDNSLIHDSYYEGNYHLDFNFESVLAKSSVIQEAWGKSVTISGGNIVWS